jgi:hypothetical protein
MTTRRERPSLTHLTAPPTTITLGRFSNCIFGDQKQILKSELHPIVEGRSVSWHGFAVNGVNNPFLVVATGQRF